MSVVVPTLGRPDQVSSLLESIAGCDPRPGEVILVAGDGSEGLGEVVARWQSELDVTLLAAPRGVSGQRNVGISGAKGDLIVFLDDDVLVGGRTFAQIEEAFADPAILGVTGRVIEPQGRRIVAHDSTLRRWIPGGGRQGGFTRYGYPRYIYDVEEPRDVEFMPGCFMCARTASARVVGFDENLSLAEDEDFSLRLSRLGRLRYTPELSVVHRKLGFASREPRSFDEHLALTRRYLFRKNFEQTALARAQFRLMLFALVAHRIVNGDLQGARGIVQSRRRRALENLEREADEPLSVSRHDRMPLELLLPAGKVSATLVIGSRSPSPLAPHTDPRDAPDFAIIAPDADEHRWAWTCRAAADLARELSPQGTAVVLAPPVSRLRIVRSLQRRGFRVAGAFLHLPSFEHAVFVVPLRRDVLRYVLEHLTGRRSWKRSLARLAARGPGPRLLRTAAPSVSLWLRRDGRVVAPDWLGARHAVLQLSSDGAGAVVHGFDTGNVLSVVAKVRSVVPASSPEEVLPGASAAGLAVPTFLRRVELGDREATVELALPGRPAASLLADGGEAPARAFLDELAERLEHWHRLTGGSPLSAGRLERETVDRAIALHGFLGDLGDYVDHLRALTKARTSGSVVAAHNDLTTWNILVDRGRLAVVDWDEAEPEGLPLGDFAYAAVDVFTVAGDGDRVAAYRRCFGAGDMTEWVAERLRRLERAAGLTPEAAELCLHACWLRHASNERQRAERPTPFLEIVREIVRVLPSRPVAAA